MINYEKEFKDLIERFKTNEDSIGDFLLITSKSTVDRADVMDKIEILERQNDRLIKMMGSLK
jgi:hypothetical protein